MEKIGDIYYMKDPFGESMATFLRYDSGGWIKLLGGNANDFVGLYEIFDLEHNNKLEEWYHSEIKRLYQEDRYA